MGKKKAPAPETKGEEKAPEPVKEPEKPDEEKEEEPKIVVDLKAVDDKYLELEREYEKEVQALQRKYTEQQAPLLEERMKLLTASAEGDAAKTGTPACKGFWLQAMMHLPALEDQVEEWDAPVLEYLKDIKKDFVDAAEPQKGFKLTFHFVENPYFTNDVLTKEYYTEETSPYTGEIDTTQVKSTEIDWKDGKDVTVEIVKKKATGGGAKKAKQKNKEKAEPRDSFFRNFFRNLKVGEAIPDDVNLEEARQMCEGEDSDEEDEDEMLNFLLDTDHDIGCAIRDQLVPFAVRWYTGEACPDEDDDDDDEDDDDDDDEDDDDDDDDDDDEEDEPAPKKKAVPKRKPSDDAKDKKKGGGDAPQPKAEECKQQ
mmetsp:Transcript_107439/g.229383  ORF Transcript_107439/g.229383 Transcript_107439/m.229383 type:complete len:369 (-) Transcript_107439:155-1261(-)